MDAKVESAVERLLTYWHGNDTEQAEERRYAVADVDDRLFDLMNELAAAVGGL